MFNVESISNKLADKIVKEVNGDEEKRAVIAYGIFGMLQIGISILLVIIFGIIFNILFKALIMSFTISILRKYSGGVHASTPNTCTVIGTLICIIIPLLISRTLVDFNGVALFGVIVFCISYYLIYKLAPVDSDNKPIKKLERRQRLKRKSIIILTIYLIIVIILLFLYKDLESRKLLLYCMCIYAGVVWQVFSLTKLGHIVLGKLDFVFNRINIFTTRR
ncbi:accessory gene regulator B family protein [Clostridium sardiniense]|uniref:Accessory gene regulator B family protein n=1 Tax=Clostridium sardiniense TaxID=29369 RepID=A0ABS7KU27_CLOSR|nr:accessory gene regulator B family protein [Clostridium sardiniense]MBY0754311.1 accessory gene regulator B family protein [Clostridium sardiniense]MDQ0461043.1 accessory gene regulator B [Clostridium sardiniense]